MESFSEKTDAVKSAWPRIVRWLERNASAHADALNPPATNEEITATELKMGIRFPVELRAWLMMNNGSTALHLRESGYAGSTNAALSPLPHHYAFLDLDMIANIYGANCDYQKQLKASGDDFTYWGHNWIPVIQEFDAPYGFLLDASVGGKPCPMYNYAEGEIIEIGHTPPSFPSLGTYLTNVADALEGINPWGRREGFRGITPIVHEGTIRW